MGRERSRGIKVCHLFKPNLIAWDEEKVQRIVSSTDAGIILQVRIPQFLPMIGWNECFTRMGATQ